MNKRLLWALTLAVASACAVQKPMSGLRMQVMKGFPADERGIELGVSACYAGKVGDALLFAGGCNFAEKPVAEGGKKIYYRGIYAADWRTDSVLAWRKAGELPAPAAYGVTVSVGDALICVGGNNGDGPLSAVYRLTYRNGTATIEPLPDLPYPLDNMAGTLLDGRLYIAGGNRTGKPSNTFLCLDLKRLSDGWTELPAFPGHPRTQAVCVALRRNGGEWGICLWGGFAPASDGRPASLSPGGLCYLPSSRQWVPVAEPVDSGGHPVFLGGGTAAAVDEHRAVCAGGVNAEIFLAALQKPVDGYLLKPVSWYRFNRKILLYDSVNDAWSELADTEATARAGAALVADGHTLYSLCGELKPGIRTPQIVRLTLNSPATPPVRGRSGR